MNGVLYVGIDPGLAGAVALVRATGACSAVENMPTDRRGKGRVKHDVDAAGKLHLHVHLLRPHVHDIAFGLVEHVGTHPDHFNQTRRKKRTSHPEHNKGEQVCQRQSHERSIVPRWLNGSRSAKRLVGRLIRRLQK